VEEQLCRSGCPPEAQQTRTGLVRIAYPPLRLAHRPAELTLPEVFQTPAP